MVRGRLAFVCVVLHSGRLFAAEPAPAASRSPEPDRVRISFLAPVSCPDKASFMAQIAGRVTIPWLADETELARHIQVTLEPSPTGFSGRMDYVDESGRTVTRSLDAPDCAQATAGIALVTAIAVETQAAQPVPLDARSRAQPAPTQPGQDPNPSATAQPDAAKQGPTAVAPASSARPRFREQARDVATPAVDTDDIRNHDMRHEAGVLAGGVEGVGPSIAFGGALFWGFGKAPFPWLRAFARWYETRDDAGATGVTAHFRVIAAGPQACIGHVLAGPVTQALCAGVELGQYLAEGEASNAAPYVGQPHSLFWAAAEAAVPLRLAASSVFVELEPAVRFPLVSGAFELQNPDEAVYEIPRVAIGLNLATGITFR